MTALNHEGKCLVCGKTVRLFELVNLNPQDIFCHQCWIDDRLPKHFYLFDWKPFSGLDKTKKH